MSEFLTPEKKQIITINGYLGSGKSTAMKGLAEEFGYETFSSGDIFRQLTTERGVDLATGNRIAEKDTSLDDAVDAAVQAIGATKERIIVDSRMAWFWIPQSYKVYLKLNSLVAAQRIIEQKNEQRAKTELIPIDPVAYAAELDGRRDSELRRYMEMYGADPTNESNYDQVIDTEHTSKEEVKARISKGYQKFLED